MAFILMHVVSFRSVKTTDCGLTQGVQDETPLFLPVKVSKFRVALEECPC